MKKMISVLIVTILICLTFNLRANDNDKKAEKNTTNSKVSYYGGKFHGRKTSSGEVFNKDKMTAASNKFPIGTELVVWRVKDGDTLRVKVKVNDKMAEHTGRKRALDLSEGAMKRLKGINKGVINVNIDISPSPNML